MMAKAEAMTKAQSLALVAVLSQHFWRDVPQATAEGRGVVEGYARSIRAFPWTFEEADAAVTDIVRTKRQFPAFADLVLRHVERTLRLPSLSEAWARFVKREPLHPLVEAVAKTLGGYHGYASSDMPGAFRSQFFKLYEDARRDAVRSAGEGDWPIFDTARRPQLAASEAAEEEPLPLPEQSERLAEMIASINGTMAADAD